MSNEIFSMGEEEDKKFQRKMNFYTFIIVTPLLIFLGYHSIKSQKEKYQNFVKKEFKNENISLDFNGKQDRIFVNGQDFEVYIIELIKNDSLVLSSYDFENIIRKKRIKLNITKQKNELHFAFTYNNEKYKLIFKEYISMYNWIYETFK